MTGGIHYTLSHTNICKFLRFSTNIFSVDISPEMLKLGRATKVKVLFLVLVFVFNFDLFKLSTAILETLPSDIPFSSLSPQNRPFSRRRVYFVDLVSKTGYLKGDSSLFPWSVTSGDKRYVSSLYEPYINITNS